VCSRLPGGGDRWLQLAGGMGTGDDAAGCASRSVERETSLGAGSGVASWDETADGRCA